jgi:hypothetical protein
MTLAHKLVADFDHFGDRGQPFEPAFPGWYHVLRCNGSNYGLRYNILCEIERGNHGGPGG